MKLFARFVVSVVTVASACPLVQAASTYYIGGAGASDSNTGLSTGAAFATFSKAIGAAQAGDTILVRGGTYNLASTVSISSSKSGTAAAPYNLLNYPGEQPVLDFTAQAAGARGVQLDGSYWHIAGLTVQNARDNGINVTGSNNTLERLRVHGNQDSGMQISGSSTRTPANNLVLNVDSYQNYDPAGHGKN